MPTGVDLRPPGSYSIADSFAALREQLPVTLVQMQSGQGTRLKPILSQQNTI